MIPDVISALRLILRTEADVIALVPAAQIYAGEMPQAETPLQPRAAVVLSKSGGPPDRGANEWGRRRVDVRCYGTTPFEAGRVMNEVHETLKHLTRRRASGGSPAITPTLVHSVMVESGPAAMRDPDGDWPFEFSTYEVLVAEVAA